MNRKFLEEKGLEKDVIDAIMAEHGKAVQAAKPGDDYEQLKNDKETLSQKIVELNATLTSATEAKATIEKEKESLAKENSVYKKKEMKNRIAHEFKIPFELANRLSGETEEEMKADAKSLSEFFSLKPTLPLGSTEPQTVEEKKFSNQDRIISEQYKSE